MVHRFQQNYDKEFYFPEDNTEDRIGVSYQQPHTKTKPVFKLVTIQRRRHIYNSEVHNKKNKSSLNRTESTLHAEKVED